MQSVSVLAPQRGECGFGQNVTSAWVHAHILMFAWQTVSFYFIVFYCITRVHVVILTYDAQLSKQQLPHLLSLHRKWVVGELKGSVETSVTHTHYSTHLVLHAKLC